MQYDHLDDVVLANADDEATRALLAGYALGITSEAENREAEALLEDYPELIKELDAYRHVSQMVLLATPPVEPPPAVWDGILSRIEADAPTLPQHQPAERLHEIFVAPRLRLSPALAAVLAAVFLGVVGLLGAEVNRLRQQEAALLSEIDQQQLALTLMRSRDVGWVRMNDPASADNPSFAWLVYSPGEQSGVILASGFPETQPDMAYQLWANGANGRVSLGLFDVDANGSGSITFQLPDDLTNFNTMGITMEPAEGSPGPTSPAVVRLELEEFIDRLAQRS
jgi:anti-sigma-K factor RskA